MKLAAPVLLLLWLAGLAAGAPAPSGQRDRLSIAGREYVRLADWARQKGFQFSWASRQEVRLTGSSGRLSFTINSQRCSLNGVTVWLSLPVAVHNGAPCIAPVDLQATLQPLLWPVRRPGARATLVCLDPGHGGKDTGNIEGRRQEKEYALALAREMAVQLRAAGFKVFLTRSWDTQVELDERAEIARRRGADLFVSLHFNAAAGSDARGAEVYCLTPARTASTNARGEGANTGTLPGNLQNDQNILLAYQLQQAMVFKLGMEDRGVRRARWAVLRNAKMPAVLVEGGFMTNPGEAKKIYSSAWRKQLAAAMVEGLKGYRKLAVPAK